MQTVETVVTIGEPQEARDPYLCYWSEWYWLTLLAKAVEDNDASVLDAVRVVVETQEGKQIPAWMIHKSGVNGMSNPAWGEESRSVSLGSRTALLLCPDERVGDHVYIPSGEEYSYGRPLNRVFRQVEIMYLRSLDAWQHAGSSPQSNFTYTQAMKLLLDRSMKDTRDNNYAELYATLKRKVLRQL